MNDADPLVAPAPWHLAGDGAIFLVRLPRKQLERDAFVPPPTPLAGTGRVAICMFVDYASSDVGPYRELLFIPGKLRFGADAHRSITRIFVSTLASVANGRRNWGIPKDRADFSVEPLAGGARRVTCTAEDGTRFADIELVPYGPVWPAPGQWVPRSLRTLSQVRDGQHFTYVPEAGGHFRLAKVVRWSFDPAWFPDLARGRVIVAARITDFRMTFPVATVEPFAARSL